MKEIKLGGKRGGVALVDDEDFERVNKQSWYQAIHGYATGSSAKGEKRIYLHRIILNAPKDFEVDHIDHNKLNCQKSNLRIVTGQQNHWNISKRGKKSKYKGVILFDYDNRKAKWKAAIGSDNTLIGYFENERHAAMAYDIWAKEWYGEYAYLNFPNTF